MAVTQQLARVSQPELDLCRASVELLDDVCSFRLHSSDRYLDLDWASTPLLRLAEATAPHPQMTTALARALNGDGEVNPAYRELAYTIWEHPVTALDASAVAEVFLDLEALALLGFPDLGRLAHSELLGLAGVASPGAYLAKNWRLLLDFYRLASTSGGAVVMWWD